MNLIVFTPVLRESAIGRMAKIVVQRLIDSGHQVTVIRSENSELLTRDTHIFPCSVIRWDNQEAIMKVAEDIDGVIYQIGDNFQLHMGCLEWLPKLPGVICLHDYFLGNLFWGWSQNRPREEAYAILRGLYGNEVEGYFNHNNAESFIEATHNMMPMTEWVASMAQAIAVHSSWDIDRVISVCSGPVRVIPLAYDKPPASVNPFNEVKPNMFVVLTIGHINTNKRAQSVIRAIGASDTIRKKTLYRLVGQIEPNVVSELTLLAKSLDVNLQISGKVDDQALACALSQADVVSCLRWPTLEAASASAIEAMLYAKPVIVTNVGFYSELPNECVVKISPKHEFDELRVALEKLYFDSELRVKLGQKAVDYASVTFSAEQYVESLIDLIDETISLNVVKDAMLESVETLQRWGAPKDVAYSLINTESLRIFNVSLKSSLSNPKSAKKIFISSTLRDLTSALYNFVASRPQLFNRLLQIIQSSPRLKNFVRKIMTFTK